MSDIIKIQTPLTVTDVQSLKAGDEVQISGFVYTARDMAHRRLCELIDAGGNLPLDLKGQVIYFVGPTPPSQGRAIGAAGPTTSSRMDAFSPKLIKNGLRGMIGKGYRSDEVRATLQENKAVHFSALGGAGALLSKHIANAQVIAYENLGTEAIRKLQLENFPAIVAYDCHGNTVYKTKA